MATGLRELWAERPVLVTTLVIAPSAFLITLLILFLAVGGGDDGQQSSVAATSEQQQASLQQDGPSGARQTAVVKVETRADGSSQVSVEQDGDDSAQPSSQANQTSDSQDASSTDSAQQGQPGQQTQSSQPSQDEQASESAAQQDGPGQSSSPNEVAGHMVLSLGSVLHDEDDLDESKLKHGTDGTEGGILPLGNGVVISSRERQRTSWEIIIPSAGMKSAIVSVGTTPRGAMGSPDNPYVVGWWDVSTPPGEVGNTLLAGHRDFEDVSGNIGTGVCWELVNTEVGDQILMHDSSRDLYFVYTVTEAVVLDPSAPGSGRYLRQTDEPVVTLITCTGNFNANTHRYSHRFVVVGVLTAVAAPDA